MEMELYSHLDRQIAPIQQLGEWWAKSGMFKCRNVEQAQMLAFICALEKKSPLQLLRENHIMDDGTLAPKARNVHARFLERGGEVTWVNTGENEQEFEKIYAEAIFSFKGKPPITVRFGIADAERQKIKMDKETSAWRKTPAKMCRARVLTNGIDLFCPDIVLGVPDDNEVEPAPAPTLTLVSELPKAPQKPKAETSKPEQTSQPTVVDVEVVKEKPEPTPVPEPVATAAPAPAPAPGTLSNELLTQLEGVIGTHGVAALRWLRKENRLKEGQGLADLDPDYAKKIVGNGDRFIRAVQSWSAANPPKAKV